MGYLRRLKVLLLLGVAVLAAGCSSDIFKAVDKKVAGVFGDSCSFANLSNGDDFCPTKKEIFVQPPLYCYKSLGSVNCYNEENPYITEKSERVRKVPALASNGAESISVEEYELRQAGRVEPGATD